MFLRVLFLFLIMVSVAVKAVTVKSIMAGDWENPICWSNHQVPTNPDTILVLHYMVINQTLTINSPTVLFVDAAGTICRDYLMETLCGASFVNYGYIYLNHLKTRDGNNHNIIQCKTSMTLLACAGYGNYQGVLTVWPPVLCKTIDTNWEGGTTTGVIEFENRYLKIYPNPLVDGTLNVITLSNTFFKLTDVVGKLLKSASFTDKTSININDLPNGIYFLEIEIDGKIETKKILKL